MRRVIVVSHALVRVGRTLKTPIYRSARRSAHDWSRRLGSAPSARNSTATTKPVIVFVVFQVNRRCSYYGCLRHHGHNGTRAVTWLTVSRNHTDLGRGARHPISSVGTRRQASVNTVRRWASTRAVEG